MAPPGLTANPTNNNGSGSPISLLWAHQLRREHAAIVAQLEDIKKLHPSSASELKKLVARTAKAEAGCSELRKEVIGLKGALQDMGRDLAVLKKREGKDEREEKLRLEMEELRGLLSRQAGGFSALVDEVRKLQRLAEEERDGVMEQKLLRAEDEVFELRSRIQVLEQKIGDAITVVKDSVGCRRWDEGPPTAGPPPAEDVSDAESFDLDANVKTVAPASGPVLGPSLAMIKEPTLPGYPQRPGLHQPPEMMGESMEMLPEPSLPPLPKQQLTPKTLPAPQVTKPDLNLIQGKSALSAYIQIADSQYEDTPPAAEAEFVDAFVHGLRDKRDRKKCEKKFKDGVKTWEGLKECFPVASQISQNVGKRKRAACVRKRRVVDAMETRAVVEGSPMPLPCKSRTEHGRGDGVENRERRDGSAMPSPARKETNVRKGQPPPSARAEQNKDVKQDNRDAGKAHAVAADDSTAAATTSTTTTRKRPLAEQKPSDVASTRDEAEPAAKKRRTKKRRERRQRERPQIPILPSSEDEFSRRWRRK